MAMEFPTTQIGFEQMFSTEEACIAYCGLGLFG